MGRVFGIGLIEHLKLFYYKPKKQHNYIIKWAQGLGHGLWVVELFEIFFLILVYKTQYKYGIIGPDFRNGHRVWVMGTG